MSLFANLRIDQDSFLSLCSPAGEHISQYAAYEDAQLERLLQTALDVERLFSLICKEEDADSKHIYFFLFKLLRKSILNEESGSCLATVEAHLGRPPFEQPSIATALLNFLLAR